ncbi:hypothetical protein, partial [Mycolicibacterium canariasense]|uniref:hypothetical protein n=1 Tax=Mycolicibacterium canariasense TaxID=228230 RepID=UPI0032D592E0
CLVRHQLVEPNLNSTAAYYPHHQIGKHTGHTKRGVHQTRDASAALYEWGLKYNPDYEILESIL